MSIDIIFKKYRDEYDRKIEAYTISCNFSIVFDNNQILYVKIKRMVRCVRATYIRQKLLQEIYSLEKNEDEYKCSFISGTKKSFLHIYHV